MFFFGSLQKKICNSIFLRGILAYLHLLYKICNAYREWIYVTVCTVEWTNPFCRNNLIRMKALCPILANRRPKPKPKKPKIYATKKIASLISRVQMQLNEQKFTFYIWWWIIEISWDPTVSLKFNHEQCPPRHRIWLRNGLFTSMHF